MAVELESKDGDCVSSHNIEKVKYDMVHLNCQSVQEEVVFYLCQT